MKANKGFYGRTIYGNVDCVELYINPCSPRFQKHFGEAPKQPMRLDIPRHSDTRVHVVNFGRSQGYRLVVVLILKKTTSQPKHRTGSCPAHTNSKLHVLLEKKVVVGEGGGSALTPQAYLICNLNLLLLDALPQRLNLLIDLRLYE